MQIADLSPDLQIGHAPSIEIDTTNQSGDNPRHEIRGLGVNELRLGRVWRTSLWGGACAVAVAPLSSAFVERVYSSRTFPVLQRAMTTVSNWFPFALFDALLVIAIVWTAAGLLRDVYALRGQGWLRLVLRVLARLATVAAVAYLAFLAMWGLNYRRQPISTRLPFDATRVSPAAALALAYDTVNRLNALHGPAHREGWPRPDRLDPVLAEAFAGAQRELGSVAAFVPGRPKRTLLDGYFRRAGVAGMTDPYFLETLVATDLLAFERPMVVAHEWSHLAGLADEGEANFAGWLTCLRGSAFHQYSAWLFLYSELAAALEPADLRRVAANLADGPRGDLAAIRERLRQHVSPLVSAAGWRVYDRYLKVNRVDEGTASYAEVVRLVLGTEFGVDWVPRRPE